MFITVLVIAQGLYVIFPLPDIWPLSNYSMFSKANPLTVTSSLEFYGLTSDGKEVLLHDEEIFLPFDRIRLKKGINRILNRESFAQNQEKKLESTLKRLRFLPVDHASLKENVRRLLPYKKSDAIGDEEEELRILFDYLFVQYERNRKAKFHDSPPIVSMNLYLTRWDWTNVSPQEVFPETKLVYFYEYGLLEDE